MHRIGSLLKVAVRALVRSPGFSVVAVLILAAGVGANTAIFSLANWALLRPVPGVDRPADLVSIEITPSEGEGIMLVSHPTVRRLMEAGPALRSFAAYSSFGADVTVAADDSPQRIGAQIVTPAFFETLGVRPLLGRTFRPGEGDDRVMHSVAVLGYSFWRDALDADPTALGRSLEINGSTFTIVGVAPPAFKGPGRTDDIGVWVPASVAAAVFTRMPSNVLELERAPLWLRMIGRPSPGVTAEAIRAELERAAPEIARGENRIRVDPGIGLPRSLRSRMTETLVTLGILVALLLLLTAASMVNLLLSRVTRRRQEASIRKALGASFLHLTADLVAEGVVLAAAGTATAVAMSWALVRILDGTQIFSWLPELERVPLDHRVLGFALAIVLLAVGVATFTAALKLQRSVPMQAMRHRNDSPRGHRVFRRGLVAMQVALSLALVVGAGLVARSIDQLFDSELGFNPRGTVLFSLNPGVQGYDDANADRLFRQLAVELERLPGVENVGFTWLAPLGPRQYAEQVHARGQDGETDALTVQANMVSPDYLNTIAVQLVSGRGFDEREYGRADRPDQGAVILNETAAELLFPGRPAVGSEIRMEGRRETAFEVIGVVADARLSSLQEPPGPALYDPFGNGYRTTSATFAVHSSMVTTAELVSAIEGVVRARDPRLPLLESGSMVERVEAGVQEERALGRLIGVFAALSLVLAGAGLFGLVSESVQARLREFGIRTALGAHRSHVAGLVLRDSVTTVALGAVGGVVLARWTGSLLESRLLGMDAMDPVTFAGATLLLIFVAVAAAVEPAVRSASVDPVRVLRLD